MNSDKVIVSIIAVCYNQVDYVVQTLSSIKAQSWQHIQLIVADDGSSDGSKEVIQNWIGKNDPSAIFVSHANNMGLTKNINSALPFVQGKYFQVFGCDDIMLPGKIETQVKALEADESAGVVYSDMLMMNKDAQSLGYSYYEKLTYKKPLSGFIYDELIDRIIIAAPTVLVRTAILEKTGNYNPQLDYEDYDFFLRVSKYASFIYNPEITVHYRVLEHSLSNSNTKPLKYFRNLLIVFYSNYDNRQEYRNRFNDKLLFCIKNLYSLKYKNAFPLFAKAFIKTGDIRLLKYTVASIPFIFTGRKA